jgi:hypothetical protein
MRFREFRVGAFSRRCIIYTVSALVREAIRERYLSDLDEQSTAMQEFAGSRKEGPGSAGQGKKDAVAYVRSLRRGKRLDRLQRA